MAHQTLAIFSRAFDDQYQRAQKLEFYERAHVHRFSVVEYDARNEPGTQLQQIQQCLRGPDATRPKVLFVGPVHEGSLQSIAREAARLGVGWVSLNRSCDYVTDLRRQYPTLPYLCVDPDQRHAGRLQAQQVGKLLPRGGAILYIHGPLSTSSARLRRAGFQAELAGSQIRVVEQGGDWTEESGFQAGASWLRTLSGGPESWAIVGQNDAMAIGASRALQEDSPEKKRRGLLVVPPVTGCDGLVNYGQRFVLEKRLAATVLIPATAGRAVDTVAAALKDNRAPIADLVVSVFSFPELGSIGS